MSVPDIPKIKVRSVAAPAMDKGRQPFDTFADEYDSDRM